MTEIDKMIEVREDSQKIGEFLEWLGTQGIVLCRRLDDLEDGEGSSVLQKINGDIEQLLAKYYNIDLKKVEEEKQRILAHQRRIAQAKKEAKKND